MPRHHTDTNLTVRLPNGHTMQATHATNFHIPALPPNATQAHVFPQMRTAPLLSIGQLCDHGCEAHFDKHQVVITHQQQPLLQGTRNPTTKLWEINIQPPTHTANNVYQLTRKKDLVQYMHAACFSPVPTTWCAAINAGSFNTWPGLTAELVRLHLPKSIATIKGHMQQVQQGLRSTQPTLPPQALENIISVETLDITNRIYSDQTGRFPVTSSRGNKYIMVVLDHDSNAILTTPMKSRHDHEMVSAFRKIYEQLTAHGAKPTNQRLDNEAPTVLKKFMTEHDIKFQLVPPHSHRRNRAEQAIRAFKGHFIAGLCTTDKNFPLHLWDRLLPQATDTLNMLRTSRTLPHMSAYTHLWGEYNYNQHPMAPPGTKVIVHEKPSVRQTWAPHGVDGWYIGPAKEHYRCYQVYITSTRQVRIADTVEFLPS